MNSYHRGGMYSKGNHVSNCSGRFLTPAYATMSATQLSREFLKQCCLPLAHESHSVYDAKQPALPDPACLPLSLVCRHWRHIALRNPLVRGAPYTQMPRHIKLIVSQAGLATRTIDIGSQLGIHETARQRSEIQCAFLFKSYGIQARGEGII